MNMETLQAQLTGDQRLDGWKRIANHLDSTVRTARRWEKDRGLPVHRHQHTGQASVYAFVGELEQWRQKIDRGPAKPTPYRYQAIAGITLAVALLSVGAATWVARTNGEQELAGAELSPFPLVVATGLEEAWTDNDWNDLSVVSDGWDFAWKADMEGDSEIFVYRDGVITQVTDDDTDQFHVALDGDRLAWLEGSECYVAKDEPIWDCAVWIQEHGRTFQLTHDQAWEAEPKARDGAVVWYRGKGGGLDIYMYRDGEIQPVTGPPWGEGEPVVSGERIVWVSNFENGMNLFEFDGTQINQLTDDEFLNRQPSIDGQWLAWVRNDGHDDEIILSNGEEEWQLTHNDFDDVMPQVWKGRVVWVMKTDPTDGDGKEIMAFDGTTVYRLTDDVQLDWHPAVSEEYIVWHRSIGEDAEIVAVRWDDFINDGGGGDNAP